MLLTSCGTKRGNVSTDMDAGFRFLTFIIISGAVVFGIGYVTRRATTEFVRADRDMKLTVCIDETDRASWNAGVEKAQFLAHTMTRACMASHGYALVTDVGLCSLAASPNHTPVNRECYWRPRTTFLDILRDDLYSETHKH
jgi:hypothetical protein